MANTKKKTIGFGNKIRDAKIITKQDINIKKSIVVNVDVDLHMNLKSMAVREGTTITALTLEALDLLFKERAV